ncbi:MAG: MBL fold metallo-hydrolase, partial [Planctomycetota bacterium]|nr:MBL fold metallo-hydrolase [Planctomycetota bacterium]
GRRRTVRGRKPGSAPIGGRRGETTLAACIERLQVGPLGTNCYIVRREGHRNCAVVDPGGDAAGIISAIRAGAAGLDAILITHCHADHIAAVEDLKREFPGAAICAPAAEADWLQRPTLNLSYFLGFPVKAPHPDRLVNDGDKIAGGGIEFEAILCPGHSPGSICYLDRSDGIMFAGDVLFAGSIGRGDLPGGDEGQLIENIRLRILSLDPAIRILPGHGPETSIGEEMASNPFLT